MPLDGVLRVHLLSKENSMEKPGKRIKQNAICSFYFFHCVALLFVRSFSLFLFCFVFIFCETISFVKCLSRFCCCLSLFFVMLFLLLFCFSSGGLEKSKLGLKKCLLNLMTARLLTKSVSTFFQLF